MVSSPTSFTIEAITSTRVILCEGSGDKSFFEKLIEVRGLPNFYVTHPIEHIHPGGRSGYEKRLRGLRVQPNFDTVTGILISSDNDRNPVASFQEVRKLIHDAEFDTPNHPFVVAAAKPPAVVVMMIPGDNINGQLETLCLEAIKDTWPAQYACAETYGQCAGIGAWSPGKQERARLRALISHICKKDPNSSLTHLWSDGRELVIPLDHKAFTPIADFLKGFDAMIDAAKNPPS